MRDKVTGAVLQDLIPSSLHKHTHRAGTDSVCLYLKRCETLIPSLCSALCREKVLILFYSLYLAALMLVVFPAQHLDCRAHRSMMTLGHEEWCQSWAGRRRHQLVVKFKFPYSLSPSPTCNSWICLIFVTVLTQYS